MWDIEFEYFPKQRHFVMSIYALFPLASGLIKMSVLLFYRRLSSRAVSPTFRWILRITIASIGVYTTLFVFIPIFMCSPISAFWDQQDIKVRFRSGGYTYKCSNEGAEIVANGIVSTVQDFIAASLPAWLCWNLQMPFRQKLALYSVFAVSYFVVAVGAIRTYNCYHLFFETYDVTWIAGDVFFWTLLELHLGSMCANAPALKAFYVHFVKRRQQDQSSRQQTCDTNRTMGSTTITSWEKFPLWKRIYSRGSDNYLNIATDRSISVQTTFQISCEQQRNSTAQTYRPEHAHTISKDSEHTSFESELEMGRQPSSAENSIAGSEVQALPPVLASKPTRGWKPWAKVKNIHGRQ
ncbi:hypothetical protein BKA66DRAFT_590975 [Pyrenochaeta sp. MPI-SDFR-AT-0127]|nr:hypothetical protein BKA66DRAFT_590975 [Pyrenochaeta sp. MPI-SDFR-AT-0127]